MGPVETEFMLGWMHARARVSIKLAIACVVLSACYRRLRWNCFPLNYIVYCLSPWIPFPVSRDASPSGSAARCMVLHGAYELSGRFGIRCLRAKPRAP